MPLTQGQVVHNRYRIAVPLGQGGMGAVYRAWDLSLEIPVALKENLDASPEAQKQFGHEARILARLSHPKLPRVTDYFFIAGQGQYLVMDFVEGEDLESMLRRHGRVDEAQVVPWLEQVCDAVAYLHNQPSPIIHRDIKPANIKVRPDGRAMLVDFGIAKVYNPQFATTIGARAVTPGYSPPEQYGAGTTDARSDVYALGATLYHLLTGQHPPESVQRMVGSATLAPPRSLNPQMSPALEQAILRATEIATDRRFQGVSELRGALKPQPPKAPGLPSAGSGVLQRTSTGQTAQQTSSLLPTQVASAARSTPLVPPQAGGNQTTLQPSTVNQVAPPSAKPQVGAGFLIVWVIANTMAWVLAATLFMVLDYPGYPGAFGACIGVCPGIAQALVIGSQIKGGMEWGFITILGWMGAESFARIVTEDFEAFPLFIPGLILLAGGQWHILRKQIQMAYLWVPISIGSLIAAFSALLLLNPPSMQPAAFIFGAINAIITGAFLVGLLNHPR
jgi:serine/threonine protein kinase